LRALDAAERQGSIAPVVPVPDGNGGVTFEPNNKTVVFNELGERCKAFGFITLISSRVEQIFEQAVYGLLPPPESLDHLGHGFIFQACQNTT
jgi:hypothetical protein